MAKPRPAAKWPRVLLLLSLVLIPGVALSVVTWRLMSQERELEAGRTAERRTLVAEQLAQELLLRLESARSRMFASAPGEATRSDGGTFVLAAPLTARGLELPWERDRSLPGDSERFLALVREGEDLEFVRGRPDLAVRSYRAAARAATSPAATVDARLREARALTRAGDAHAGLAVYAAVAAASPELRDEEGMPFALYGAEGLLVSDPPDPGGALAALEAVNDAPVLAPLALHATRDLAGRIIALDSADGGDRPQRRGDPLRGARGLRASLTARIEVVDRLLELRRDLPALLALAGAAGPGTEMPPRVAGGERPSGSEMGAHPGATTPRPVWIPYGPEPWLVSVAGRASDRYVLVADPTRLLRSIAQEGGSSLAGVAPSIEIASVPEAGAELLGPSFPAVFAVIPDAALPTVGASQAGAVLLLFVIPLVLAMTAGAAFLLWRDVRREVETARLRAQFVSGVSHELKTPLTSIRMFAETLLLGRRSDEADRREYLETIVNESERLTRLINNVLDFSRIERDGRSYRMQPVHLDTVVEEAVRAMSYPLTQGGFDVEIRTDDGLPMVHADGDAVTQAVVNLLSNAVKFSGGRSLIELELARDGDHAVISVRDHGRGIERRYQRAVFARFFRAPEAEAEGVPGTGLGLALADHVARAHRGSIELESAPGLGSTFTLRLPLAAAASEVTLPEGERENAPG